MSQRLSISPKHALDALALPSELSFSFELQFLAPPPRNMPDVIKRYPELSCIMERDFTYHVLADALDRGGLPAAYLFETTKDECRKHPLRRTAPKDSIVRTLVSNDMRIMGPRPVPPSSPSARLSASLSSMRTSRITASGKNPLFEYWLFRTEPNVYDTGALCTWHPAELNSPILGEGEAAHNFQATKRALAALVRSYLEGVHTNKTCAMHVHVSPARGPLTPLHVKRVATLVFLLEEHLLFPLCDPSRRRRSHTSLLCGADMSINTPSDIHEEEREEDAGAAVANLPPALLSDARIRFLWNARDMHHVAGMIARPGHDMSARETALGVKTQRHPDGRTTRTIEFRHAEASLRVGFVTQWLALVTTVCKVAWLDARRYKGVLEEVCGAVGRDARPGDAWRKVLRIVRRATPEGWRVVMNEGFWEEHLTCREGE